MATPAEPNGRRPPCGPDRTTWSDTALGYTHPWGQYSRDDRKPKYQHAYGKPTLVTCRKKLKISRHGTIQAILLTSQSYQWTVRHRHAAATASEPPGDPPNASSLRLVSTGSGGQTATPDPVLRRSGSQYGYAVHNHETQVLGNSKIQDKPCHKTSSRRSGNPVKAYTQLSTSTRILLAVRSSLCPCTTQSV